VPAPAARTGGCPASLPSELASTGTADQVVTVVAAGARSTTGMLRAWQRSGGCWRAAGGPFRVYLGYAGVSEHHREGDGTTPAGAFPIGPTLYGIAPDPGFHYPYRRLVCGDWWDEDPASPGYNTLRHVRCGASPSFAGSSEALWKPKRAYAHFAFIAYNVAPTVPGRGSAIFLHADLGHPTNGCVSLPPADLDRVLGWLRPRAHPLVVIGTAARIRGYRRG
jgi:L,D-peptidoglycan transpeptidase YkuD (ErfK/YbiS/YcfS/YnhG family)